MMVNATTDMNMEVATNREVHSRTLLAFCCGALLGATLGILVAPPRGRDTRHRIASTARTGRKRASRLLHRSRKSFDRQTARVRTLADGARTHARHLGADVVDAVQDAGAAFERARKEAGGH
jgi:gas vesicle protein